MTYLANYLDYLIFGTLGLMSFIMVALVIERHLFFRQVNTQSYIHVELLTVALTKNLTSIASIGANAPYVGLLGTVMGILISFNEMGMAGDIRANSIMVGLAMALKATAAGLLVAIPTIVFYNALQRRVETLIAEWKAGQADQ